jgi:flavodoxin
LKTVVVYYSRSGNTKMIAELIGAQLGADLEELIDTQRRAGMLGFLRSGRDAVKERTTQLAPLQHRLEDYDLIIVGTPVWAGHCTPAVRTFLQSHDFSGKRVALFCTMSSRGAEEVCAAMRNLLSGTEVIGHLGVAMKRATKDQIEKKVTQWAAQWKDRE